MGSGTPHRRQDVALHSFASADPRSLSGICRALPALMPNHQYDDVVRLSDLQPDTTVDTMAMTAKDMSSKYKETSEGGLAVSLVLC